jgi:hypothetical protein
MDDTDYVELAGRICVSCGKSFRRIDTVSGPPASDEQRRREDTGGPLTGERSKPVQWSRRGSAAARSQDDELLRQAGHQIDFHTFELAGGAYQERANLTKDGVVSGLPGPVPVSVIALYKGQFGEASSGSGDE